MQCSERPLHNEENRVVFGRLPNMFFYDVLFVRTKTYNRKNRSDTSDDTRVAIKWRYLKVFVSEFQIQARKSRFWLK